MQVKENRLRLPVDFPTRRPYDASMGQARGKGNWLLVSAFFAFFLPAALIGFLALGMVADQKKIRENELRESRGREITLAADRVETEIDRNARQLFAALAQRFTPSSDRPAFLQVLKSLLLENRCVSYPFVLDMEGRMILPTTRDPLVVRGGEWMGQWDPPVSDPLWWRAEHAEFSGPGALAAIPLYLALERRLPEAARPDVGFAVSRCYLKAGMAIQAREYGLDALRRLDEAPRRRDRLDLYVLRQLGLIALRMERPREAFSYSLRLYEALAPNADDLLPELQFLRWEALDFLRNNRDIRPYLEKERIAEIDSQVLELYRGEISLFSDLEEPPSSPDFQEKDRDRFLKLKEIFDPEAGDTLFYRGVEKGFRTWRNPGSQAMQYRTGTFQGSPYLLAFSRLSDRGGGTFTLGFRMQVEELLGGFWPKIQSSLDLPAGVAFALVGPDGEPFSSSGDPVPDRVVLAVAGRSVLAGWTWQLRSRNERLFSALASRSLRWYYALIAALFASLALGIVLLLRYLGNEKKLLRQKADFVDMTSHTLKTPLTRLRLLAEKLEQGWITEPGRARDHCRAIADETANMAQLVDRMLDFSALQAGRVSYGFSDHSVRDWLQGVLQKFQLQLAEKEFQVEVDIAEELPAVRIDPEAMGTVLSNLVENALQYAATGKYFGIQAAARGGGVEITVSDRGPGIAPQNRKHLFDAFSSGGAGKNDKGAGRGLGLAICRQIVDAHGGVIRAEDGPLGGTRMIISLPLAEG